jgi:hypothetical protein
MVRDQNETEIWKLKKVFVFDQKVSLKIVTKSGPHFDHFA